MTPISFKEQNMVFAKDQPEYLPLPAFKSEDGEVISCWSLSWKERIALMFFGRLWLRSLTFNKPLQPLAAQVTTPFRK